MKCLTIYYELQVCVFSTKMYGIHVFKYKFILLVEKDCNAFKFSSLHILIIHQKNGLPNIFEFVITIQRIFSDHHPILLLHSDPALGYNIICLRQIGQRFGHLTAGPYRRFWWESIPFSQLLVLLPSVSPLLLTRLSISPPSMIDHHQTVVCCLRWLGRNII